MSTNFIIKCDTNAVAQMLKDKFGGEIKKDTCWYRPEGLSAEVIFSFYHQIPRQRQSGLTIISDSEIRMSKIFDDHFDYEKDLKIMNELGYHLNAVRNEGGIEVYEFIKINDDFVNTHQNRNVYIGDQNQLERKLYTDYNIYKLTGDSHEESFADGIKFALDTLKIKIEGINA
ncbi:hypothetical protein ACFSGI_08780 [Paenibacillus nicotianae]|uniref:Uncharacterized protein n=1 Tax=Paenibacillus nicotianae TaxID=1526551 RepID=A0ABW4UUP8_9BACL